MADIYARLLVPAQHLCLEVITAREQDHSFAGIDCLLVWFLSQSASITKSCRVEHNIIQSFEIIMNNNSIDIDTTSRELIEC